MLNSGTKFCALRDKKINILTIVLSEKKILNETKTITPLQVKWLVPKHNIWSYYHWVVVVFHQ